MLVAAEAPASSYVIPASYDESSPTVVGLSDPQRGLFPTKGALCLILSTCYVFPAGEYRLSRKDGAHYQGVPHPCQPLGSVLQPVSRTYRNLHTGRSDKGSVQRLLVHLSAFCFHALAVTEESLQSCKQLSIKLKHRSSNPLVLTDKWDIHSKIKP